MATRILTILKRVGLGVLVLAGMLLVLGLTVGIPVPGWFVRDDIERTLSHVLNHDFALDGALRIRVSLNPRVHVTDVSISDANRALVTAEAITASLNLRHLLDGEIVVNHVTASGVHILDFDAFTDVNTGGNGDPDKESDAGSGGIRLAFNTFQILDSSLNWELAGVSWRLAIGELTGTAPLDDGIAATLQGTLRDLPVQLELSGETLAALVSEQLPWTFSAKGAVDKTSLNANGELQLFSPFKMQSRFDMTAPGVGIFNHLFELPLPDPGKLSVTGVFGFDDEKQLLSFTDLDATVGHSDFGGQIDVQLAAQPPKLVGQLTGGHFVADDWLGPDAGGKQGQNASLDLDRIIAVVTGLTRDLGAQTHLQFDRVDASGIRLDHVDTLLTMTPGRLAAESLSFALGDSKASGEVAMAEDAGANSLQGQLDFPDFFARDIPLLDRATLPDASFANASIAFDLRGADLPDMYEHSSVNLKAGPGKFRLGESTQVPISKLSVSKAPGETAQVVFAGTWNEQAAELNGNLRWNDEAVQLALEPRVSEHVARVTWTRPFEADAQPTLHIKSPLLDIPVLRRTLAPGKNERAAGKAAAETGSSAYKPVRLPDMALSGEIDRVVLNAGTSLESLQWTGGIRDHVLDLALQTALSGHDVDTRIHFASTETEFEVDVSAKSSDVSLRALTNMEDAPDATLGAVQLDASSRGTHFAALLGNLSMEANVQDADLPMPAALPAKRLHADTGTLKIDESAVSLRLAGNLDGQPLAARLQSAPLHTVIDDRTIFPLSFDGTVGEHHLRLNGQPDGQGAVQIQFSWAGPSLDSPTVPGTVPWLTGPFTMEGRAKTTPDHLVVHDLTLDLGSSRFVIDVDYDTRPDRPRLNVSAMIPRLDIRDFVLPVSPAVESRVVEKHVDAEGAITVKTEGARAPLMTALQQIHDKLPDMGIRVFLIGEVADGPNDLGQVLLEFQSTRDGLLLDPLMVYLPEGNLVLTANLDLTEPYYMADLIAHADSFDYGTLLPLFSTDAAAQGMLDLDARIWMDGPTIAGMRDNLNGRLNVVVWPTALSSKIIDAWTGSIFQVLMPVVNSVTGAMNTATRTEAGADTQNVLDNLAGRQRNSVLNCIVLNANFERGVLVDESLLMDTTGSVVHGKGKVNFPENTIDFRLIPQAKIEKFFSIATPIDIKGKLDNFRIRPAPGGLIGTAIKFYYNVYYVILRRISGASLPPDGFETCYNASLLHGKESEPAD